MPEGHTIHRLARDLNRSFRDRRVAAGSPQGRFAAGAERLDGQVCSGFDAFGKHLVGRFETGEVLHVHLGLIGKFRKETGDPVGQVRLRLSDLDADGGSGETDRQVHWDLRGPMVCELGPPELADRVAASVGPDPLDKRASAADFVTLMNRRSAPIGAALLDQKAIAGVGNVYRAELLFLAGIGPRTPARSVADDKLHELWDLAVTQLRRGEKLNRIVTVDPVEVGCTTAARVRGRDRLYVYKRAGEPCRRCATPITRFEVGGRKMWECPTCQ